MRADVLSNGSTASNTLPPSFHNRYQYLLGTLSPVVRQNIRVVIKTNIEAQHLDSMAAFSAPPATPTTLQPLSLPICPTLLPQDLSPQLPPTFRPL